MTTTTPSLQDLSALANALRHDVLRSTSAAGSGHPTSCLSCAEIMATLFFDHMRFDVSQPTRLDNDHFILSKGHAAPILWAVMHRAGVLSEEELLSLREIDSPYEGHPTPRSDWVQVATGSLGQGLSAALGMALVDRLEGRTNATFALLGDGEVAEGSIWEAAALASHHQLANVCAIVDVNGRGQTGPTMLSHDMEAYARRFHAFGWHAQIVDGHDTATLRQALRSTAQEQHKPSINLAKTTKGAGVSSLEGEKGSHGKAAPDLEAALKELPPVEIRTPVLIETPEGDPQLARPFDAVVGLERPDDLFSAPISPRKAFGAALADWGTKLDALMVFDGEVSNSTYTQQFAGEAEDRFVPCYIAEQNMVSMAVGAGKMGRLPLVSTFSAFFTRAFDQLRMAAISRARLLCVGTHAGIVTGEDGPSQMGLEDIAMFRVLPGSTVLQPADGPSTVALLEQMGRVEGIGYLRLVRPSLPPLYDAKAEFRLGGSHTLRFSGEDQVALLASGATVHAALEAAKTLAAENIAARVVDLYSIKPIDVQALAQVQHEVGRGIVVEDHYAEGGLGEAVAAHLPFDRRTWRHLAVARVPHSGSGDQLAKEFNLSAEAIARTARELLA